MIKDSIFSIGEFTTNAYGTISALIIENDLFWIIEASGDEIEFDFDNISGYITTNEFEALKTVPFQVRSKEFDFSLLKCTDFIFQFGLEPTFVEALDVRVSRLPGDPLNQICFEAEGFVERWLDDGPELVWCKVACVLKFKEITIKTTKPVDEAKCICDLVGADEVFYVGPGVNGGAKYKIVRD